jgi:hypothetical protein
MPILADGRTRLVKVSLDEEVEAVPEVVVEVDEAVVVEVSRIS